MKRLAFFALAAALAAPAAAQEPPQAAPQPQVRDFDLAREKVVNCEGQKFVFAWGGGANPTKVTLCSKKGATTAELIELLSENADKLEHMTRIAEDRRTALVQQMRAKINELSATLPAAQTEKAAPPPAAVGKPSEAAASTAARAAAVVPKAGPVAAASPQVRVECIADRNAGVAGPCVDLTRETVLRLTSSSATGPGLALRFLRRGEERGRLAIPAVAPESAAELALPRTLCAGVASSEVEIDVVQSGTLLEHFGPYRLRC